MAKNELYTGVYGKMDFPEYVYREFPKMVKLRNGTTKIVNTHAEELAAIDEIVPKVDVDKIVAEKATLEKLLAETQAALKASEEKLVEIKAPPSKTQPLPPAPAPARDAPELPKIK